MLFAWTHTPAVSEVEGLVPLRIWLAANPPARSPSHSDERNGRRSAAACGVAFSGASHRPHSSGACPPRGQSSGPLSPESPRPLRATEVPGPVVLQPRRLPTPSRSGDLWKFLGAPPRSSTPYDLGALWVSGWMPGPRTPPGARCADTPTRVRAHRRANPVNETISVQFSSD